MASSVGRACQWGIRALGAALCVVACGCSVGGRSAPPTVFYPPLPEHPRLQFLCALRSEEDFPRSQSAFELFVLGKESQPKIYRINRPHGMAFGEGKLYVCDSAARTLAVFDFKERRFSTLGGKNGHQYIVPASLALGPQGEKYVCDSGRGEIHVFDREGRMVRRLRPPEPIRPVATLWREGELYVADVSSSSILVLDPAKGSVLRRLGKAGGGVGEFGLVADITFGPQGDLYVCDAIGGRVLRVDRRNGKVLQVIGRLGDKPGELTRPKGIAVDREGRLYVADAASQFVHIFDPQGRLLLFFGGSGATPGDMNLPARVLITYEGIEHFASHASPDFRVEYLVFVGNQYDAEKKINVYGFGTYLKPLPGAADEEKPGTAKTEPPKVGEGAEKKRPPPEDGKVPPPPPPAPKEGGK